MNSTIYKLTEFFVFFVLIPVSFIINYDFKIKLFIGIIGLIYICYVLLKIEKIKLKMKPNINWKFFWKETIIKLVFISIITTFYMVYVDKENLFVVILNKPKLWLVIIFVYSFLSVYPQELIYRAFFFKRYHSLFKNDILFIFLNAILFSIGHLLFKSSLVLVLTFFGGLLFAVTYSKTKSTLLVSIEHAIYGCWLFTVGMGSMLGFPT